jgi:hypothetical protein
MFLSNEICLWTLSTVVVSSFKTRLLRRLVLKRLTRIVNYEFPDLIEIF